MTRQGTTFVVRLVSVVMLGLSFVSIAHCEEVAEPKDYRMDHYRGPVPSTLEGAIVVNDETAYALWKTGRVAFVDVLPQAPKPENLPEGTIWHEKQRNSIPGAIWLPNVGYGKIADITLNYFLQGLISVTQDDMDTPVVFYCLEECWMSWNAAKRALEHGYKRVYWYPEGTDGWDFEDHPLFKVERWALP